MQKGTLTNLTPHDVCIITESGQKVTVLSYGVLRLKEQRTKEEQIHDDITVVSAPVYTGVDRPKLIEDDMTDIIVSMPVAQYMIQQPEWAHLRIFCPDTGPHGAVRDKDGRIVGTKRLVQYQ